MLAPRALLKNPIRLICSALLLIVSSRALAQTNPPPTVVRDPNAMALVAKSLQAIAGATALTDITLQANANYTAGSDVESGPATLVALGNQMSSVTLNLTNGQRKEIRSGIQGVWVGADGTNHAIASHNCFIDASWFYPAFTLVALATDPTLSIVLEGEGVHNGEAVYDLLIYHVVQRKRATTAALIQGLSTMNLYLDATTLLPAALDFNLHPDRNTAVNMSCEILYGGYQAIGGVQTPTRIQKYLQNSLLLDLAISTAAVNSGVPATWEARG